MKKIIPIIFVAIGLAILATTFIPPAEPPEPAIPEDLKGVFIDSPAVRLPDFELVDHNNRIFNNASLKGQWSLVFFGFTNCPDVCPTSMTELNKVSAMPDTPEDTQYVFISVDPKRDSSEKLKEFVTFFNDKFIGVSGQKSEIDKFKEPLGVIYGFEGDTTSEDYVVTHFAAIYLIAPDGKQRAYALAPHSAIQISRAYQLVRKHYD